MARSERNLDPSKTIMPYVAYALRMAKEHAARAKQCGIEGNKEDEKYNSLEAIHYYSEVCKYLEPETHPYQEEIGSLYLTLYVIQIEQDPFSQNVSFLDKAIEHLTLSPSTITRNYLLGEACLYYVNYLSASILSDPEECRESLNGLINLTLKSINYFLDSQIEAMEKELDLNTRLYHENLGQAYQKLAEIYEARRDINDINKIREYRWQSKWMLMFACTPEISTPSRTQLDMSGPLFQPD